VTKGNAQRQHVITKILLSLMIMMSDAWIPKGGDGACVGFTPFLIGSPEIE
jgi:hypothetical protein